MSENDLHDLPFNPEDDYHWDPESGRPGIMQFASAVQIWSIWQPRSHVTVAEAAAAFNCTGRMVRAAIEEHPWMFANGPDDDFTKQIIEHEGE